MRYVALLRGVNPVNAPNARLVALFEQLGFADIQTVGSSGNVIFTSEDRDVAVIERTIETALSNLPGVNGLAVVRSAAQIKKVVAGTPFDGHAHTPKTYLAVTFFKHTPSPIATRAPVVAYEPDAAALCTVNDNTARPPFMTQLERSYGKEITTRTWSMVEKIARKMST